MGVRELVEVIVRQRGAKATSKGIRSVGRESKRASGAVKALTRALAALGVGLAVRGLLRTADASTRMDNQIRTVTSSTEEFNAVQRELFEVANRARAPISDTVGLFQRLRVATRDLGASQADVLKVTEGLSAAIVVSGKTAQEGGAALIQLSQGLASGRFGGDELRSVLEGLPTLAQALADKLGVTVGQLRELGASGKLNAQTVFPALVAISDKFINQLDGLPITLAQAGTVLSNTFQAAVGDINVATGATTDFADALLEFNADLRVVLPGLFIDIAQGLLSIIGPANRAVLFIKDLNGAFKELQLVAAIDELERIRSAAAAGSGDLIGFRPEDIEKQIKLVSDLRRSVDAYAESQFKSTAAADAFDERINKLSESLEAARTRLGENNDAPFDLTVEGEDVTTGGGPSATALKSQETALERIISLTNRLRVEDQKRVEPLNAQLEKIKQQQIELIKQGQAGGDISKATEGLLLLGDAREAVERKITDETERQNLLFAQINVLIAEAAAISPLLAEEIQAAADAAVLAGGGLEKVNDELESAVGTGTRGLEKAKKGVTDLGNFSEGVLNDAIGRGITGAINGEGFDAMALLADVAGNLMTEALNGAVSTLSEGLSGLSFGGGEGEEGGGLGAGISAGIGATITAASAILSGALQSTSTSISNDLIRSASSQSEAAATRGVIAGPTNIPIFQIGTQLAAAFVPTEGLLEEIRDILLVSGGVGGGLGSAGASSIAPGRDIDTSIPALTT